MSRDGTRTRSRHQSGDDSAGRTGTASDPGFDVDGATTREPEAGDASVDGVRERVGRRAKRLFSPRAFLAALALSVGGLFVANAFVPLPGSGLLGVFLAAFLLGLVTVDSRYAEAAAAGGVAVSASVFLDVAVIAILGGFGLPLALLGGVLGAAAGGLGIYFGRDLRDGLTRSIDA